MHLNTLGKSGVKVTPVGFGVLTMGHTQMDLPIDAGADVITYAMERGINFFDTAEYYRTYPYLKKGLDDYRRSEGTSIANDIVICSKTLSETYLGANAAIEEARMELDLDVIDIFLLHEIRGLADWEYRQNAWNCLMEAKAAGVIKAIGISTHFSDVTKAMADVPECDVVFPLLNMAGLGIRHEAIRGSEPAPKEEMEEAIKACSDAGQGIFTMKAFGGGHLTGQYLEALDYVTGVPGVDSVMVGIGSREEVDRLVEYGEGIIDRSYAPDISKKRIHIDFGDCEGCGACIERCPNNAIDYGPSGLADIDQEKCLRCGYCAPVCPVRAIVMY